MAYSNLESFEQRAEVVEQRARERDATWREREVAAIDALPMTSSERDGSFAFDPRENLGGLLVWQAGMTTVGGGWRLTPDGAEELVLIAAPTVAIQGRVVDSDRQPVEKASVRARMTIRPRPVPPPRDRQ